MLWIRERSPDVSRESAPITRYEGVAFDTASTNLTKSMMNTDSPSAPGLRTSLTIALVAMAALSYEVTLTRVFSFVTWYHFVYLVIGVALLGYGAAGTFLTLRSRVTDGVISIGTSLFAIGGIGAVVALSQLAFDPATIQDYPARELVRLAILVAVVFVPFLGAGLAICGILSRHGAHAGRLYAFDLVGAGIGCALTPFALRLVGAPNLAGALTVLLGLMGLAWAKSSAARLAKPLALLAVLVGGGWIGWLGAVGEPRYAVPNTKPYHHAIEFGIGIDYTRWSALPRIDVTNARELKLFGFGGELSARFKDTKWTMHGVLQDGTAHTAMLQMDSIADLEKMPFLDGFVQGAAFELKSGGDGLVIGVGGGIDVLIALQNGMKRVVGVEMNPIIASLLTDRYRDFVGGVFQHERVDLRVAEGRQFLATTEEKFDAIQLAGVDTFAALSSGAFALAEAYVYTVDAVEAFMDRLAPGGVLAYSRYIMKPPRETIRNASNMVAALERRGIDPTRAIAVVAGKEWANCMLKPDGFSAEDLSRLRAWATKNEFRLAYDPERPGDPAFDKLIRSGADDRLRFLDDYHYDISPVTDDRPFFFQYFKPTKWSEARGEQRIDWNWINYIPSALLILLGSLLMMTAASFVMILVPVLFVRRKADVTGHASRLAVLVYFSGIGLGFLFVEIALMQRFTVYLGNPTLALSIVLFSILLSSGIGSALSKWAGGGGGILFLLPLVAAAWPFVVDLIIGSTIGESMMTRSVITIAALAPVGFCLGLAFPLGVRALSAVRPGWVSWAFAINACFTVIASSAAVVAALLVGFSRTFLIAAGVYMIAALAFRGFNGGIRG